MAGSVRLPYLVPTNRSPSRAPAHEDASLYLDIDRRIAGDGHVGVRSHGTRQTFPVAKQNGHLVSRETTPPVGPNLTYYQSETGSRVRAEHPPRQSKRRLQSLPSRKPKEDETMRKTNSAPYSKGAKVVAPLPKLNNLMAKLRTSEREQTYGRHWSNDHAGITTKGHDSQNHRSHKFATSWANARAEQANLRSNDKESPQHIAEKNPEPPKSEPQENQTIIVSDISNKERALIKRRNEQTLHHMFHASDNKENSSPREEHRKKNESPFLNLRSREKKPFKNKQEWNPSYVVEKPPVVSRRRQEEELTHHPALTEVSEVYKAYTGVTKRDLRKSDDNISRVFSQYGEVYQATITVSPRNKKEYVLTLREADTYRKMNSVYGADGLRKKRKSLLLQKLVTVELEQIKQYNQKLREREKKRNESKRRQQKQLYTIRKRFKEQQSRRFRSQYVTSRVLEHEKMNRKEYGLPEEDDPEGDSGKEEKVQEETSDKNSGKKKEKPIRTFDKQKKKKAYEKKYKNMFDINVGPSWDPRGATPKMEGVDIVTLEVKDKEGNVKEKKTEVKDVVKEARKVLQASTKDLDISDDESRAATPTSRSTRSRRRRQPSVDSLEFDDDDDDDIFERARRKYHLDVDSTN